MRIDVDLLNQFGGNPDRRYGQSILANVAETLEGIPSGRRRRELFLAAMRAGNLVADHQISPATAEAALLAASRAHYTRIQEKDLLHHIRRGLAVGAANPGRTGTPGVGTFDRLQWQDCAHMVIPAGARSARLRHVVDVLVRCRRYGSAGVCDSRVIGSVRTLGNIAGLSGAVMWWSLKQLELLGLVAHRRSGGVSRTGRPAASLWELTYPSAVIGVAELGGERMLRSELDAHPAWAGRGGATLREVFLAASSSDGEMKTIAMIAETARVSWATAWRWMCVLAEHGVATRGSRGWWGISHPEKLEAFAEATGRAHRMDSALLRNHAEIERYGRFRRAVIVRTNRWTRAAARRRSTQIRVRSAVALEAFPAAIGVP